MYVQPRLGLSMIVANPPVLKTPAIFTLPGDSNFSLWTTMQMNVAISPAPIQGPGGFPAQQIAATGGVSLLCTRFQAFAPLLRYNIFAHIGSGALDANKFDMYNVNTKTTLARGVFDYGSGSFLEVGEQLGRCRATLVGNGWYCLSFENGAQTVTPGDDIQIYAGFEGNTESTGEYGYFALASVTDQSAPMPSLGALQQVATAFNGPHRGLKIALAGAAVYYLLSRK